MHFTKPHFLFIPTFKKKTSCMTDRKNMSERSFVVGGFASFVFISFKFLKVIKKYLDCDFYATLNCITKGK